MTDAPLEIDVNALKRMRDAQENFVLLDVREDAEIATAKINGSLHIPMGNIPSRVNELFKDKRIIVHCHHGGRSMRVTRWLRDNGFENVSNLAGGIDAWSTEIDPAVPRY